MKEELLNKIIVLLEEQNKILKGLKVVNTYNTTNITEPSKQLYGPVKPGYSIPDIYCNKKGDVVC